MKLLFISQLFDPEYAIKGLSFLSGVQKSGLDIDVITTFPNYPTGRVYPGYKNKLWQVEFQNGIRVIRVYSYISHSRSKISRILTYFSFMVSALIASLIIKRADVIYAYHPQITIGIVAWLVRLVKKTPYITDVQDLWPDTLVATGFIQVGLLYKMINQICNFVYKNSEHIVVLSKGYKEILVQKSVPAEKISFIYNWNSEENRIFDECNDDLFSMVLDKYNSKFVYAGNLGAAQSLKSVISAFSRVEDDSVCLIIIGSGVEEDELKNFSKSLNAENIFFIGYVPSTKIKQYLDEADVLVVHLKDDPLFKITIPSKLQTSLNAGKPILMAVGGEANEIVESAGAGVCALPENVTSIVDAANSILKQRNKWQEMGKRGKQYYEENMSQQLAVEKIVALLKTISKS